MVKHGPQIDMQLSGSLKWYDLPWICKTYGPRFNPVSQAGDNIKSGARTSVSEKDHKLSMKREKKTLYIYIFLLQKERK